MRSLLFCLLLALATPALAEVYKWTDEQGKVHYSNVPPPTVETEPVKLTHPEGVKPPERNVEPPVRRNREADDERSRKQECARLQRDIRALDNSPSGLALRDGNQRAERAARLEAMQQAFRDMGC